MKNTRSQYVKGWCTNGLREIGCELHSQYREKEHQAGTYEVTNKLSVYVKCRNLLAGLLLGFSEIILLAAIC